MIVTTNWLKEYVDIDIPTRELADLLTMLGLEVERVEEVGSALDTVVVARVLTKEQHPNADKLSLCTVDSGSEILEIVCGATNFSAGDTVALAQVGSVLPGDFRIKRSRIRGIESCGMLCSEKELGLADESEGIMILPPDLPLGRPLFDALGLKDTILEIGITPNRADCLSVIGIAREIAAKLGKSLHYPPSPITEGGDEITKSASVEIVDPDLCPRYTARLITGVTLAPSPSWLVSRLAAAGIRSINNVVDVTNYVLLEYGHPLHAFDFRQLRGGRIIVRRAADGEIFRTLDGQERQLCRDDLTIRDAERAVALAGIMGGENSEITEGTTDILLESAWFDPRTIRRTSRRLGVKSESSYRFERGADIDGVIRALDRATSLIAQLAGGTVAREVIDAYPRPVIKPPITLRTSRVNGILGTSLQPEEIAQILRSLTFTVAPLGEGVYSVQVPTFRVDIDREIDLVEEVARLVGYGSIPVTLPESTAAAGKENPRQVMERHIRDCMVALGFNEVINFSFTHPDAPRKLLLSEGDPRLSPLPLLNPLVTEQSVMRTTLVPEILGAALYNLNHRQNRQRLFELRRLYLPAKEGELPQEPLWLAALMTGPRQGEEWCHGREPVDFYDLKGVAEELLHRLGIGSVSVSADETEPYLHPGKSAVITAAGRRIGVFGELHPRAQENFQLTQPVFLMELSVDLLVALRTPRPAVTPPSRFPDSARDIALLLDDSLPVADLVSAIDRLKIPLVTSIVVFDVYRGEKLPPGKKSIALRIRYGSADRTLTDDEINRVHDRIVRQLQEKFAALQR
ncbi:MAG: phenylalanine--tRNA ligase subunit beta [Desulfuromonadia bacterium]